MPSADPTPALDEPQELHIRSVLLVEDDVLLAILIKKLLEEADFMVTTVENGADALREVMAFDFDAIICDMVMPKMPGDMFFLAVSRAKPHLCERFVFITGHGSDPKVAEFLTTVTGPVLHKPVPNTKLVETVRSVAGRTRGQ